MPLNEPSTMLIPREGSLRLAAFGTLVDESGREFDRMVLTKS
jgi:hypothetical protein